MPVTQSTVGRFHHFHLARQLHRHGLLDSIWTGFPRFKLRDEAGIPPEKIHTFPWLKTPHMALARVAGAPGSAFALRELAWWASETFDLWVAAHLNAPTILVGLSGSGRRSGVRAQSLGGRFVCDRGSSHIRHQDRLLREEHRIWGLEFEGVDPRAIDKEEAEYELADLVTVPSSFALRSFVDRGVPAAKLRKLPYGARLERFRPSGEPAKGAFEVLFVGAASLQKGVLYLLDAFARLRHPKKRLRIVGTIDDDVKALLSRHSLDGVEIVGPVPNAQLATYYSTSNVMVLPSIQDGFGMVMAEALACGCPVVASTNTGASDLFTDGAEGLIVPIRSVPALKEALERFAQDAEEAAAMRRRARARALALGGWDTYGDLWHDVLMAWSEPSRPPSAAGSTG